MSNYKALVGYLLLNKLMIVSEANASALISRTQASTGVPSRLTCVRLRACAISWTVLGAGCSQ